MSTGAIVGRRVSLRRLRDEDSAAIEVWYQEAASAAGIPHPLPVSRSAGEGRSVDPRASGLLVIERQEDSAPIGLVEYEVIGGWLEVEFIALAKEYRGWGYASEAVRLIEEWAVRKGIVEEFRVEVNARNGLGLYFWLRLGYRPTRGDEFRWREDERPDSMAMVRTSEEARMQPGAF